MLKVHGGFRMKSLIFGLAIVLFVSSPAFAARRCRSGRCGVNKVSVNKVYTIPTVGKSTYTVEHPAVAKPVCKDGKCRLTK